MYMASPPAFSSSSLLREWVVRNCGNLVGPLLRVRLLLRGGAAGAPSPAPTAQPSKNFEHGTVQASAPVLLTARLKKYAEDFVVREIPSGPDAGGLRGKIRYDVPTPDCWDMDRHYMKPRGAASAGFHRNKPRGAVPVSTSAGDADSFATGDKEDKKGLSCGAQLAVRVGVGQDQEKEVRDPAAPKGAVSEEVEEQPAAPAPASTTAAAAAILQTTNGNTTCAASTWQPRHLWFTVAKRHRTTEEARSLLAKHLKVGAEAICYGGLKDRRGITFQTFSVRAGAEARKLEKRLRSFQDPNIFVSAVRPAHRHYALGMQQGNHFQIGLRDVRPAGRIDDDVDVLSVVRERAAAVAHHGFLNYFGAQRFGRGKILSSDVGRALLIHRDYKHACSLIIHSLKEGAAGDGRSANELRTCDAAAAYDRGDFEGALEQMPRSRLGERNLLRVLQRTNGNYERALLEGLPRTMGLFYVRAYISHLWNRAVAGRVDGGSSSQKNEDAPAASSFRSGLGEGNAAGPGASSFGSSHPFLFFQPNAELDLVCVGSSVKNECRKIRATRNHDGLVPGEHLENSSDLAPPPPMSNTNATTCTRMQITLPSVRAYAGGGEGEQSRGAKTDLVVPLWGRDVVFNDYWRDVYKKLLAEDSQQIAEGSHVEKLFEPKQQERLLVPEGGYRRMFAFPRELTASRPICAQISRKSHCENIPEQSETGRSREMKDRLLFSVPEFHGHIDPLAPPRAPGEHLVLSFSLACGEYATVCLREILGGEVQGL